MKTRTTIFDIRISDITSVLKVALNGDAEHPVEERYVKAFCERVVNSMWRCVSSAIATMELYGDAEGFIFNMGGYIDAMYDMDEVRWKGFSDKQVDELEWCYPQVVQLFREVALDIIEMYLRCMVPYDIELAAKYIENSPSNRKNYGGRSERRLYKHRIPLLNSRALHIRANHPHGKR